MRVIAKKALIDFWSQPEHRDSEIPLRAWHETAERASWSQFSDVKESHRHSYFAGGNRVICDFGDRGDRLVAAIGYKSGFVEIKFVGTIEEYSAIDAATVEL